MKRILKNNGFTLIELLVVIAIILVLMGLLFPIFAMIRKNRQILLAQKQVKDIHAAATAYYEVLHAYPPDRAVYGTASEIVTPDPNTIYRYLGIEVTDALTGQKFGPFLVVPEKSLQGMLMVDPWGNPYEFDALHVQISPTDGSITRYGEPYSAATLDKDKRWDLKVWSWGPDGINTAPNGGSNTGLDKGTAPADADNITSWAN